MNDSFSPTKGILNQLLQRVPLPLMPRSLSFVLVTAADLLVHVLAHKTGAYAQEVKKARPHKLFP